jgi:hypothetical protein
MTNILTQALHFFHLPGGHNYHDHDFADEEYELYKHIEHIDEPLESTHCKYCDYDNRTQQEKYRDSHLI